MGTPREVQRALELLQKVDIKQPQVLIEARVMDISEASLRALGFPGACSNPAESTRWIAPSHPRFPIAPQSPRTSKESASIRMGNSASISPS
jgi:hypothetical protein